MYYISDKVKAFQDSVECNRSIKNCQYFLDSLVEEIFQKSIQDVVQNARHLHKLGCFDDSILVDKVSKSVAEYKTCYLLNISEETYLVVKLSIKCLKEIEELLKSDYYKLNFL
jgi:hypothetical protein